MPGFSDLVLEEMTSQVVIEFALEVGVITEIAIVVGMFFNNNRQFAVVVAVNSKLDVQLRLKLKFADHQK